MHRYLKIFNAILLLPVFTLALIIIYASITDYHPVKSELLQNPGEIPDTMSDSAVINLLMLPGQYSWPKRLFMLDRCLLVMRFPVSDSKELLDINTHNEACDIGSVRDQQMTFLKEFLRTEFMIGSYIIVQGDWNQCPPVFKTGFKGEVFDSVNYKEIKKDFLSDDCTLIYDNCKPYNRQLDIAYKRDETHTTVIDFFLLSPIYSFSQLPEKSILDLKTATTSLLLLKLPYIKLQKSIL
jgi:hypothetical protein